VRGDQTATPGGQRVDVVQTASHEGIDAAGGLIEKQHPWGVQRGAGECQALLKPSGRQRRVRLQMRREFEHVDHRLHPLALGGALQSVDVGEIVEVLRNDRSP